MLNIGTRRKGKWRRKKMLLACGGGRAYDKSVKEFEKSGRVERAAKEAQQELESSERDELERAQETARRASKGDDAAGRR
jgi:hypothetical protein